MHIERILSELSYATELCPKAALEAAIEQRELIIPELLKILQITCQNYSQLDENYMGHIFAAHLLAQFREPRAFPFIMAIASLPNNWPEYVFGDFIAESLSRIMASTFNGDIQLIKQLIENPYADCWSRGAAINCLLSLVACDKLTRNEVIEYFKYLFNGGLEKNDVDIYNYLVAAACDLYPEELMADLKNAFDEKQVDGNFIDWQAIAERLKLGKELALNRHFYSERHYKLIDNAISEMEWWHSIETECHDVIDDNHSSEDEMAFEIPQVNIINIPQSLAINTSLLRTCRCGSSKPYSKCCLQ